MKRLIAYVFWWWNLRGCDYKLAACGLMDKLAGRPIPKELAALLDDCVSRPGLKSAVALLSFDAQFYFFFEASKPDGLYSRRPPQSKILE